MFVVKLLHPTVLLFIRIIPQVLGVVLLALMGAVMAVPLMEQFFQGEAGEPLQGGGEDYRAQKQQGQAARQGGEAGEHNRPTGRSGQHAGPIPLQGLDNWSGNGYNILKYTK